MPFNGDKGVAAFERLLRVSMEQVGPSPPGHGGWCLNKSELPEAPFPTPRSVGERIWLSEVAVTFAIPGIETIQGVCRGGEERRRWLWASSENSRAIV